jgi:hypothetical protein
MTYPAGLNVGPHESHPATWVHCECGWYDTAFYQPQCADPDCESHIGGYVHYHARDNAAYVVHFPEGKTS